MHLRLRAQDMTVTRDIEQHVEQRLRFALARFNGAVRSVAALLHPDRDGRALCRIEVRTAWNARIETEERDADLFAAISRAAERTGRAVERQTGLRQGLGPRQPATQFGD
jgi:ribosomal subunit interface protein